MQLYFVAAIDDDDVTMSLDLFVTAETPQRALKVWEGWTSGYVGGGCSNPQVFLVPQPATTEHAHLWHEPAPLGVPTL